MLSERDAAALIAHRLKAFGLGTEFVPKEVEAVLTVIGNRQCPMSEEAANATALTIYREIMWRQCVHMVKVEALLDALGWRDFYQRADEALHPKIVSGRKG